MQLGPAGVTADLGTAARPMELVTVQGREGYEQDIRSILAGISPEILVRERAMMAGAHC